MEKLTLFGEMLVPIAVICVVCTFGWILVTWLKVRNGYPLSDSWGRAVYPKSNDETVERVRLLSQENAQLRAELGSIKDRLANVERIVTDGSHLLEQEIEQLRGKTN
jgi:hypothetical protein